MRNPRVLLAAFLLFVLAAAVARSLLTPHPGASRADPRMAAENTGPFGARGFYLWLRELGYPSRSWRKPLTALDGAHQALVVLEPSQAITPAQSAAVFDWVEAGGVLIVAPGGSTELENALETWVALDFDRTAASDVRGDRIVQHDGTQWRYRETTPDERGQFDYPVPEVAVPGAGRVRDDTGEHSVLLAREGLGLVAEVYHGDGLILVFPEGDLLTNRGLPRARNAELVASLVESWIDPGTVIWFDEYDHGARVAGSLLVYLARRRPGPLAVALLAVGVLLVLRHGRALALRRGDGARRRHRPTEFVEALGGLYARSHAVEPAWAALAGAGRRLIRGELGGLRPAEPDLRDLQEALALPAAERTERGLVALARTIARTVSVRKERA